MQQQIGRYEIRRELERGGMATVYLAYDPPFKRQVAIKVLPRQFTHDPKYLSRFEQEAQAIATLEHPAIVPVYDFGEHEDAPYLVMRYMPGGSLRNRLSGEPVPLEEIVSTLERVALALDYSHQFGIIHRDLKPGNIFFDHERRPYLADFGLARLAEASQTMTVVGTPAYMSPEQVGGDKEIDSRADIYAMGVVLYELLTGKQPYTAETATKQMMAHVLEPIPNILEANADLHPEAQNIINKSMAKDREERYSTAADLVKAVRDLASGELQDAVIFPAEQQVIVEPLMETSPIAEPSETGLRSPSEPTPGLARGGSAPPVDGGRKAQGFPGWVWWAGALALLVVAVLGLRGILIGSDQTWNKEAQGVPAASVIEVTETVTSTRMQEGNTHTKLPISTDTPKPSSIPTETTKPTDTPRPSSTPTKEPSPIPTKEPSPTPKTDPNIPPVVTELGDTWQRPSDDMMMVFVPAGSFLMGSANGEDHEAPVHEVNLDSFWIDQTEVSNAQYTICENEGNCGPGRMEPIPNAERYAPWVSWEDADKYCSWVSARLPTEAEWEYAARGPEGHVYPWGSEAPNCDLANFGDCGRGSIPVDALPGGASWVGALNMAGNVWEWTNDWYFGNYYLDSPARNPQGPDIGNLKVLRGGGMGNDANLMRSSYRLGTELDGGGISGIRCVISAND